MIASLEALYSRELNKLIAEINAYSNAKNLWLVPDGITNSAGNLCLHLIGNLNHFIGTHLGGTDYVRQRDLEFSQKHVAVATMTDQIEELKKVVTNTLHAMQDQELQEDFPILVFADQRQLTKGFMLTHLLGHLSYHLGQINYHRRLLDI